MGLPIEFGTMWPVGRMAHAEDCKSFYIGSIPVPASILFRLSSAVEQSAVNRSVVRSNRTVGAKKKAQGFFLGLCFHLNVSVTLL